MGAATLLSLGLFAGAGTTANAADVEYIDGYPNRIVNGDFEYLSAEILADATEQFNFANVDYDNGEASTMSSFGGRWFGIPGFDAAAFGWRSTQTDTSVDGRAPIVEIQQSHDKSNAYAEITASQAGTFIYQDVSTPVAGAVYTISLKHASRTEDGHDALSVMIGAPGAEQPIELTRTASDSGDPVGVSSATVESTAWAYDDEWDTYEATYTIPEGQAVTRFTFRSVRGTEGGDFTGSYVNVSGNCVDDIDFQVSWPLTYDLQGGQGLIPNKEQ